MLKPEGGSNNYRNVALGVGQTFTGIGPSGVGQVFIGRVGQMLTEYSRLEGSYLKLTKRIRRCELLILDDFGLVPFDEMARQSKIGLVEDHHDQASTIITSQIPVSN